jgi:ABC-type amino acid transport system permease subunit
MFRLNPVKVAGVRLDFGVFNAIYALILIPSALWMPLTFAMLEAPSEGLWWTIRLTLAAVGIGALGLLAGLVAVRPSGPSLAHKLGVAGSVAFFSQTAVLDALVWPAYFSV